MSFASEDRMMMSKPKEKDPYSRSGSSSDNRTAEQIERDNAQAAANRHFPRLHQQHKAAIKSVSYEVHADTAIVFWPSGRSGHPPKPLPAWDDLDDERNKRRMAAIEEVLNKLLPVSGISKNDLQIKAGLLDKLDVLLGPRAVEAQAKASQDFLCPERQFYRQVYWGILNLLQQDFRSITQKQGEQLAWEHLKATFTSQKKCRVFLESMKETYVERFPFLKENIQAFFQDLFKGDALKISLMELLDKAHQGVHGFNWILMPSKPDKSQLQPGEAGIYLESNTLKFCFVDGEKLLVGDLHLDYKFSRKIRQQLPPSTLCSKKITAQPLINALFQATSTVNLRLHNPSLLSPDTHEQALQQQAMDKAYYAYCERVVQYLTVRPEEISVFADLLNVDFKEGSTQIQNIQDLAVSMASMPSRIPEACSENFLKRDWFAQPEVVEQFLARGAPLAHAANIGVHHDPKVWKLLQNALINYRPHNPCDEAFRQQLLAYAQDTTRDLGRFSSVMEALLEAKQPSASLASALYPKLMIKEISYWKHSSLFWLAKEWSAFPWKKSPTPLLLAQSHWQKEPVMQTGSSSTTLQLKGHLAVLSTVTGNDLTSRWRRFVAEKPAHITTLQADHVSFWTNPDAQDYQKLDALLSYCYTSPLTTLSFVQTELTDQGLSRLFKKRIPTVQQLILKNNFFTNQGLEDITEDLPYWRSLKTVDLSGNLITDQGVQALLAILPSTSITDIIFGDNPAVSTSLRDMVSAQLVENLQPLPEQTTRSSLFFGTTSLPTRKKPPVVLTTEEQAAQEAAKLLAAFSTEDNITNDTLTFSSSSSTVQEENSLTDTDLSGIIEETEEEKANAWIATLPTGSVTPMHLNLSFKQLQHQDIPLPLLMVYLSTCEPTLASINFEGQSLKGIQDADFEALVRLFSRFPHLKTINFNNTWLSSLTEKPLNDTLERKRAISSTSKLTLLIQSLHSCSSLQTLHLKGQGNWFGKEDCVNLIALVEAKKTLVEVAMNEDAGTEDKQDKLKKALKKGRILPVTIPYTSMNISDNASNTSSEFGRLTDVSLSTHSSSDSQYLFRHSSNANDLVLSLQQQSMEAIASSSLVPRIHSSSLTLTKSPDITAHWHRLVPWDGDELIFQFNDKAKAYFDAQYQYFIANPGFTEKPPRLPNGMKRPASPQKIYYDAFKQKFFNSIKGAGNASTGFFSMIAGPLGQAAQWISTPVQMASSSAANAIQTVTAQIDQQERLAYYKNIVDAVKDIREDQREGFVDRMALLLTQQYAHCVHKLTQEQAEADATHALNWLAYAHDTDDCLIEEEEKTGGIHIHRVNILMTLIFGYRESLLLPIPSSSLKSFQHLMNTPRTFSIVHKDAKPEIQNEPELLNLPIALAPTEVYQDTSIIDPQLRRFEQFARQVVDMITREYKNNFRHSLGYYERFFMPLLLGHGGKLSIANCNELRIAAKSFSLIEFLNVMKELNPQYSGLREASLQVRLIEHLTQPPHTVNSDSATTPHKPFSNDSIVLNQARSISFFESSQKRRERAMQREKFSKVIGNIQESIKEKHKEASLQTVF